MRPKARELARTGVLRSLAAGEEVGVRGICMICTLMKQSAPFVLAAFTQLRASGNSCWYMVVDQALRLVPTRSRLEVFCRAVLTRLCFENCIILPQKMLTVHWDTLDDRQMGRFAWIIQSYFKITWPGEVPLHLCTNRGDLCTSSVVQYVFLNTVPSRRKWFEYQVKILHKTVEKSQKMNPHDKKIGIKYGYTPTPWRKIDR